MKEVDVQIRRARGLEDYEKIVDLEKVVWGYSDAADLAAIALVQHDANGAAAALPAACPGARGCREPVRALAPRAVGSAGRREGGGGRRARRRRGLNAAPVSASWIVQPKSPSAAPARRCGG